VQGRCRASSGGLLRAWRLIACLVLSFCLLCLLSDEAAAALAPLPPPVAGAGELDEAPLCDQTAASVGVRAEVAEVDGGRFETLPCDGLVSLLEAFEGHGTVTGVLSVHRAGKQPAELERDRGRPDATCASVLVYPARGEAWPIAPDRDVGLTASSGHRQGVYRPPARA
jgi:hypothetical protein